MENLRLQGYVSPDSFQGTPTEKLQQALDVSRQLDIGRVTVTGNWTVDKPLRIHAMTELVLDHASLSVSGDFPLLVSSALGDSSRASWSFEDRFIRLTGTESAMNGSLIFYHVHHLIISGIELHGPVKCDFVREARITNCSVFGETGLVIGRGCNNFIVQGLSGKCDRAAVCVDVSYLAGDPVLGKETEIHELILQDSSFEMNVPAIMLQASEEDQIFNVQIDHIENHGPILLVGEQNTPLPETQYYNLTVVECISHDADPVVLNNPARHCYFA